LWDKIWKVSWKSLITAGCQMIPSCSGWGSHPTWNGSYIHSKHIKGDSQNLMQWMGIWSPIMLLAPHLWDQISKVSWKSLITTGCQMLPSCSCLGLKTTWNGSHIHSKHINSVCQTLCSGWGYGAPIILLPPHLWDWIWKVSWNHWSLLGAKWYHHAVVEALIPHGMIPKSTLNIYKVIDKHCMHWMGIWSPIMLLSPHLWDQISKVSLKSWITTGCQMLPSCSCLGSKTPLNGSHIHS
jgi:hypothetical protein